MADIFIPGDELDDARQALSFVLDHIDIQANEFDFPAMFGPGLRNAAQNFDDKWNDGRERLQKQVKEIKKAMDSIADEFAKTDNDAASNLSDS
ncbi:hypothetical protein [Streptomyces liangshanensis]|uniref:WXG100 family type VII secretion target n=1 Tax=Streptomyces liangshanensis TaxID=2717324 RepID=A0A6G9H873_9ACTN|nr:hypothetical protein [Streptomyces liangshanensis]QIQ06459.1 hypothetical protein HA039_32795 [Streptomyces liangshanensis]